MWNAVLLALVLHHEAGKSLQHRVHGRFPRQRPCLPEAGDRKIDQPGIALRNRVVAEAETVDHTGAKALHKHMGAINQPLDDPMPRFALQVDRDRALAQIAGNGKRRVVAVDLPQSARPVAV